MNTDIYPTAWAVERIASYVGAVLEIDPSRDIRDTLDAACRTVARDVNEKLEAQMTEPFSPGRPKTAQYVTLGAVAFAILRGEQGSRLGEYPGGIRKFALELAEEKRESWSDV